jgi:hypothetical protein
VSDKRTPEKALAELRAIYASVTRATGRPPAGPFRSASVPGWSYYPETGVVVGDAPEDVGDAPEDAR